MLHFSQSVQLAQHSVDLSYLLGSFTLVPFPSERYGVHSVSVHFHSSNKKRNSTIAMYCFETNRKQILIFSTVVTKLHSVSITLLAVVPKKIFYRLRELLGTSTEFANCNELMLVYYLFFVLVQGMSCEEMLYSHSGSWLQGRLTTVPL